MYPAVGEDYQTVTVQCTNDYSRTSRPWHILPLHYFNVSEHVLRHLLNCVNRCYLRTEHDNQLYMIINCKSSNCKGNPNSQGIFQKSGNKFLTTRFFHQVVEKGS